MSKAISSDLVGMTFPPVPFKWDAKDVMLYAVGVGAKPEGELEFVFEGKGPKVLPTFAVIPGMFSMGGLVSNVEINLAMLLHGEQAITLHREIPPDASVRVTGRISEVWDKGKAAVIGSEGIVEDENGPLFTTKATLFIRGAGGFGGERGPSTADKNAVPNRAPDHVIEDVTRPEQGAIYRLSGDRNPIHIDPDFARMAGFERPFVHGLCTYGFVGRAILKGLCAGEPARLKSFEARFADQVYFGDTIITKLWVTGPGEAIVQAESQKGNVVLSQARATFKP
ncbi:MAG: MaoC family dehydratase N-terminal domain-containing protein [Deltaproteobacteria bacterium]|nr:MaoC family dehydratase N-terminal domain-containing protein [Deltaproteobacteria bacterium]